MQQQSEIPPTDADAILLGTPWGNTGDMLIVDSCERFLRDRHIEVWRDDGRLEEAATAYRASEGLSQDPYATAELSQAYVAALSGNRTEALEMVHRIESERSEFSRYLVASVLAAVGETDEAFARLESMMERKEWFATVLKIHPWIDPLREDPRFEELLDRLDFPET